MFESVSVKEAEAVYQTFYEKRDLPFLFFFFIYFFFFLDISYWSIVHCKGKKIMLDFNLLLS